MATNDYIEKDLGIVTAYGEAVAAGYQGTRADFQELLMRMANGYLNYNELTNKPSINGVQLQGNKTSSQLNINTVTSYASLTNKPKINGIALDGNVTSSQLGLASITTETFSSTITINHAKGFFTHHFDCHIDGKTPIGIISVEAVSDNSTMACIGTFEFSDADHAYVNGVLNENIQGTQNTCRIKVLYI